MVSRRRLREVDEGRPRSAHLSVFDLRLLRGDRDVPVHDSPA